jgi:predicted nucleic acid-binding protein
MILLDTNVVSEPLKAAVNQNVLDWIDAQIIETLYLSTISLAELRFGIAALPEGKRRDTLRASARAAGQAIAPADGYIAAIAAAHNFAVATRDTSPFEAAGLTVINPWTWQAH